MIKTCPPFCPDRSTYHVLLSQSCKSPNPTLSSVRKTLNLMVTDGFHPDKVTTDIAVRTLCNADRIDDAVELVKEFCLKHSPPDTYTYNLLIKHLCRTRTLNTVNNFITEMRESFEIKPDLVSYTILIDNVCNRKNLREATRLLELLTDDGFKPDRYVYNTIMKGYCMLSQGSEVLWVYKKMKEDGVEPDMVTYNTLIFGLSKSGRVKEARKFLGVMAETGHFPDEVTYTSLMNGMCREGNAFGAVQLLEEMEAKGCTPNSCTYNTLLHGLCKGKLLEKAIELYGVMKEGDMKLETGSYGTFLRLLCRHGRIAEAYEVFDYSVESRSLKDVAAYSTLESTLKWLKKAKEQGLAGSEVLWVYKKMKEDGVEPDLVTYNTWIFVLSKSGRFKEAMKFLVVMVEMGHFLDEVTYTSLMNGLCREGNAFGAVQLLESGAHRICVLIAVLCFRGYARQICWKRQLNCMV
ncbi:unnamed protein product [Camellia sinensis]